MKRLRDRLLLLTAGVGIIATAVGLGIALEPFEQSRNWFAAFWATVLIFGTGAPRLFRRRRWGHAERTLALAMSTLLVVHCVGLWAAIYFLRPDLRMLEWFVIITAEIWVFSEIMGRVERRARRRPGRVAQPEGR